MKTLELCIPCVELMTGAGYEVSKVKGGIDNKITCANCKKRRYGSIYTVQKKKKC